MKCHFGVEIERGKPRPKCDSLPPKRKRAAAAKLYAAALLFHDDGELAAEFNSELRDLAYQLLRRAKWPHGRIPNVEDIETTLRPSAPERDGRENAPG